MLVVFVILSMIYIVIKGIDGIFKIFKLEPSGLADLAWQRTRIIFDCCGKRRHVYQANLLDLLLKAAGRSAV